MTHKLASNENFDIVRGGQTVRMPFDATDPQTPTTVVVAKVAANPTAGNLAALDAQGNPTDSKIPKSDIESLLFAQYYPDGSVKSTAEFTPGIKYDNPDTTARTITVKSFCNSGTSESDNSGLVGRVVIPPFVDAQGNGYISDDGTRFKVVGVSDCLPDAPNVNLTTIIAPSTVTDIGIAAFHSCTSLTSVSLPAAMTIELEAFRACTSLTSVSLPAVTTIVTGAFFACTSLTSVSLPAAMTIAFEAFRDCTSLTSVDFGGTPRSSVPTLITDAFLNVSTTCKIIVPDAQYDAWTAASEWSALVQAGYKFLKHSEWEYARKYEVDKKADKPATFTTGNLAALDAEGNLTDSQIPKDDVAQKGNIPYDRITITTGQLQDHAVQKVELTAATTTITLPALTNLTGKVSDFGIDMVNGYEVSDTPTAASFQLAGTIGTDYNIIVPEGEDWSEMSALAAGEMAQFYFTLSAFAIGGKPTWKIVKQVVEQYTPATVTP